jgi:aspartate racemase
VKEDSRAEYLRVIESLQQRGAQGILLGCTELGLIVSSADVSLPLFDTTEIHAKKALELALMP